MNRDFFSCVFGPAYSPAEVQFIKNVGKFPIQRRNLDKKIVKLLKFMKKYEDDILIQRICCDTISNLCMNSHYATEMILTYKVHKDITKTLKKYYDKDWKLCWKACSALWNMARSEDGRWHMDLELVSLLITIMIIYDDQKIVVNTAMGALSNLALNIVFKEKIGKPENMKELLRIIEKNSDQNKIFTTAIGLMANLAANTRMAKLLIEMGLMRLMKIFLESGCVTPTFLYNTVAVLSNCSNSSDFITEFVRNKLLESFAVTHGGGANLTLEMGGLILHTLVPFGIEDPGMTTSYHLASKFGLTEIFYEFLKKHHKDEELDFNLKDQYGRTLMSYAIENSQLEMVSFLARCGSYVTTDDIETNINPVAVVKIRQIIGQNKVIVLETRKIYDEAIIKTSPLNAHVGMTINSYISPYILTEGRDGRILDQVKRNSVTAVIQ